MSHPLLSCPGNWSLLPSHTFRLERRFAAKWMFASSPPDRQEAPWDKPRHQEPRDQSSGFRSSQLGHPATRPHTAHHFEVAGVRLSVPECFGWFSSVRLSSSFRLARGFQFACPPKKEQESRFKGHDRQPSNLHRESSELFPGYLAINASPSLSSSAGGVAAGWRWTT